MEWLSHQDASHHLLVVLHPPYSFVLWNVTTGTKLWKKSYTVTLNSVSFNPFDSSKLACKCRDPAFSLFQRWRNRTRVLVLVLEYEYFVSTRTRVRSKVIVLEYITKVIVLTITFHDYICFYMNSCKQIY